MSLMRKNEGGHGGAAVLTIIGPEAHFHGSMTVRGSLRVDGRMEGNITDAIDVVVVSGGEVRGNIAAERVEVGGTVNGDVTTSERLEIKSGGKVIGNIRPTRLLIEDGGVFDGGCNMVERREAAEAEGS